MGYRRHSVIIDTALLEAVRRLLLLKQGPHTQLLFRNAAFADVLDTIPHLIDIEKEKWFTV